MLLGLSINSRCSKWGTTPAAKRPAIVIRAWSPLVINFDRIVCGSWMSYLIICIFSVLYGFSELVQWIFKCGNIQKHSNLSYLFLIKNWALWLISYLYVIIYKHYKVLKNGPFFYQPCVLSMNAMYSGRKILQGIQSSICHLCVLLVSCNLCIKKIYVYGSLTCLFFVSVLNKRGVFSSDANMTRLRTQLAVDANKL